MFKRYLLKMKGMPAERGQPCWRDALCSWIGAFSGMAIVGWLSSLSMNTQQPLLMVGSFGATSVLLYAVPESALAQPRNVIGGSVLSSLIGVACWQWLGDGWLSAAVAIACSILVMQMTHTLHPPGGAAALIAVTGSQELHALGWSYALMPIASGCLVMLIIAVLVNNLARHRRYPRHWW